MDWNKLPHTPSNALLIDSGRRWGVACNVTALSPATVTQGDLYHVHWDFCGKRLNYRANSRSWAKPVRLTFCAAFHLSGSQSGRSLIRSDGKLTSSWVR